MSLFEHGLVKEAIQEGYGSIIPITPKWDRKYGVALMNPSIFNDNGIIKSVVRCVNYVLHHAENKRWPQWSGPLQYIHPENDVRLATENFLATFDKNLNVISFKHIDMLNLHNSIWEFHGLEDARLFRWDNRLYICGVRRDTTPNGQGRMELSEIIEQEDKVIEVSRNRIPAPGDDSTYCEKNWMPILDMPYHFISWGNPTNIVEFNSENLSTSVIVKSEKPFISNNVRGNTHVLKYENIYFSLGHDVHLWKPYNGEKNSYYDTYVFIWDEDFNLLDISSPFKFMNSMIEFSCGMCYDNDGDLLISFADVDNAAYILKVNPKWFLNKVLLKK